MDVQADMAIPTRVAHVEVEKMKTMAALLQDPNPIHWDVEAARGLGMGDRVVNQGPINMAYVMNMLVAWMGNDPSRLRALTLRFLANVFDGDTVEAGGRVVAIRQTAGERLADCEVWLDVVPGSRALSGTATLALP